MILCVTVFYDAFTAKYKSRSKLSNRCIADAPSSLHGVMSVRPITPSNHNALGTFWRITRNGRPLLCAKHAASRRGMSVGEMNTLATIRNRSYKSRFPPQVPKRTYCLILSNAPSGRAVDASPHCIALTIEEVNRPIKSFSIPTK